MRLLSKLFNLLCYRIWPNMPGSIEAFHERTTLILACFRYLPSAIFSEKEEEEIANWIRYRSKRGFPLIKTELLDCVQNYTKSIGKETPFKDSRRSRHWYKRFFKRHPHLAMRTSQHLTSTRASVSEENLRK